MPICGENGGGHEIEVVGGGDRGCAKTKWCRARTIRMAGAVPCLADGNERMRLWVLQAREKRGILTISAGLHSQAVP